MTPDSPVTDSPRESSNAAPVTATLASLLLFVVSVAAFNPDNLPPRDRTVPSNLEPTTAGPEQPGATSEPTTAGPEQPGATSEPVTAPPPAEPSTSELPGGGTRIFAGRRFLVAYYGTARSGALGVLGEAPPDRIMPRLRRAAAPFKREGELIQPVYELIVTIADAGPGRDGDFNHDIRRADVAAYVAAARRNKVLLILDIQPGRTGFLNVAKRWAWALRDPWVGLALDPEWRVGPRQVPAQVIGSVSAEEVNRTAAWLAAMVRREGLPEKILMLHQFRSSMIRDIDQIRRREGLAMIQHIDGFGKPGQKLATYRAVARPRQFAMGFKLFYDEDRPRMGAAAVRRLRPIVRFVSFQ